MKNLCKIGIPSLIILLMQFCAYPYVFYILFNLPGENIMGVVFFGIIALYLIFSNRNTGSVRVPRQIITIMVMQALTWLFYSLLYYDTSYLTRIFFIALTLLGLSMLCKKASVMHFAKVYNIVITVQAVLGVIAFFLVFVNLLKPVFSYSYENSLNFRYLNCYILTCSNAVTGNFIRIGGFFDEPGAFAFWGMFALLSNKLLFDNRRIEILLIISLFFTFSAAYFILLPIYIVCFYSSRIKSIIAVLLVAIPLLLVIYNTFSNNESFLSYTTERFEGGQIKSQRYELAEHTKKIFYRSPIFGVGAKNLYNDFHSTDNQYEILAKDGIVGFIVTYLPLFFIALKYRKRKEVLFSSIILFLDYMQRPFHINEMHFFMIFFFCLFVMIKYENHIKSVT